VTLYYFDPKAPGYVNLLGHARLVDTPEARQRHWQRWWDAFYAKKSDALLIVAGALKPSSARGQRAV